MGKGFNELMMIVGFLLLLLILGFLLKYTIDKLESAKKEPHPPIIKEASLTFLLKRRKKGIFESRNLLITIFLIVIFSIVLFLIFSNAKTRILQIAAGIGKSIAGVNYG